MARLSESLRGACAAVWSGLAAHAFVRELRAGTLPLEKFRFFLEQDLLYLPELCRAIALGAAKADDPGPFARALADTLEVEIPSTRRLLERAVELGAPDRGGQAALAPAALGYASWLVATAFQGGALEVMAAVLPCAWSYGEIGAGGEIATHPLYADWLRFYAGAEYAALVEEMRAGLERLATGIDEERAARVSAIFAAGARFERAFWDMAYRLEQWPDLRG